MRTEFKNDNHLIYEYDNFFSNEIYKKLEKNFPLFQEDKFFKGKTNKLSFNNESNHYRELLRENFTVKYFEEFSKSKFLSNLFKSSYLSILKNSCNELKAFYLTLMANPLKKPKLTIQYSYLPNNSYIYPHTDGRSKLMSVMIYFPEYEDTTEKKFGTVFLDSEIKNFNNKHCAFSDMEGRSKVFHRSEYVKNKVVIFFRGSRSWHYVDKIFHQNSNYLRRSVNINFLSN